MKTCKKHVEHPVSVYRQCVGCELQALSDERDRYATENQVLRKALIGIRDSSSSKWACEVAADALVDSRTKVTP